MRIVDEYGEHEHPSFGELHHTLKASRDANRKESSPVASGLETAKELNSDGYTYYAFVSYSHKDEKWGKWIQNALERYRLPAAVRKEVGKPLPQRIHPVFRDDTDLGACRLEDGLQRELELSRFLIVVCSPNSAKPNAEGKHWVNEEVARFCAMGRSDRVIPVIVDGTPETAFCPKIVEEGLLGLDATKHSRVRVLNDLVAKILGLRPDELWRREERRIRSKRRLRLLAASAAAAVVAFGGYIWWDCTRTVTRAFADYVDSYGLPEGIFPLTPEQVSHRHVHYRFEFKGYRFGKSIHADSAAPSLLRALGWQRILRKVVLANSFGLSTSSPFRPHNIRPQIQEFEYENGILRRIVHARCSGKNTFREKLFKLENWQEGFTTLTNSLVSVESGYSSYPIHFSEERKDLNSSPRANILYLKVDRNTEGRIKSEAYLDGNCRPTPNSENIYGISYQTDGFGRITAMTFRDEFNRPKCDRHGICSTVSYYENDLLVGIAYHNKFDTLVSGEYGWSSLRHSFSCDGNPVVLEYKNVDGSLAPDSDHVAIRKISYDSHGFAIAEESYGPLTNRIADNCGVWRTECEYDDLGRVTSSKRYAVDGTPTLGVDGKFHSVVSYDAVWNTTSILNLGINGQPRFDNDNIMREITAIP